MAVAYNYSSVAGLMRLVGPHSNSIGTLTVDSVAGLPTPPFKVVIDPGQSSAEEICKVTGIAGTNLTVTRGWDGTSAVSHNNAAEVRHVFTAEDARLSRQHEDSTSAHGVSGNVVGTSDTQSLTNKTFQATGSETPLKVQQAGASTSDVLQVLTSGSSIRAKFTTLGLYLRSAAANVVELMTGDGETANNFIARLSPQTTSDAIRVEYPAGPSAKALKISANSVEKAYIRGDGVANVSGLTVVGTGSVGGGLNVTGDTTTTGAMNSLTAAVTNGVTAGSVSTTGNIASSAGNVSASGTVSGATGTFTNLTSTNLISAPSLKATGDEGNAYNAQAPAGTPLIFKFFSKVPTTNSAGGFSITFPGGAFPNGVMTVILSSGDNNADQLAVRVLGSQVSLSGTGGQVFTSAGVGVNTQQVRINGLAIGY